MPTGRETDRETDISTKPPRAQASPRLPVAHGDESRPQGSGAPPGQGPQAALGLSLTDSWAAPVLRGAASDSAQHADRETVHGKMQRRDFLRLRHRGMIARAPGFVLQAYARPGADGQAPRLGFTVTKRIGNAVERNRIRRRLREAVRLSQPAWLRHGHDYALIARRDVLSRPYSRLVRDLDRAFHNVHKALRGASDSAAEPTGRSQRHTRRQSSRKDGCS